MFVRQSYMCVFFSWLRQLSYECIPPQWHALPPPVPVSACLCGRGPLRPSCGRSRRSTHTTSSMRGSAPSTRTLCTPPPPTARPDPPILSAEVEGGGGWVCGCWGERGGGDWWINKGREGWSIGRLPAIGSVEVCDNPTPRPGRRWPRMMVHPRFFGRPSDPRTSRHSPGRGAQWAPAADPSITYNS